MKLSRFTLSLFIFSSAAVAAVAIRPALGADLDPFDLNSTLQQEISTNLAPSTHCDQNPASGLGFEELATKLGVAYAGNGCPSSIDALIKKTDYVYPIPAELQFQWNCHHLQKQLDTDSMTDCRPDPQVLKAPTAIPKKEIEGKIRYVFLFREPYKYSVERDVTGQWTVTVKIAFHAPNSDISAHFDDLLKKAEKIWNTPPNSSFAVKFRFLQVDPKENPDFELEIFDSDQNDSRRRFNDGWGTGYNEWTVAHEIGHMLGLNDEYDPVDVALTSQEKTNKNPIATARCSYQQLMCNSWSKTTNPDYYYYLILRRAVCAQDAPPPKNKTRF